MRKAGKYSLEFFNTCYIHVRLPPYFNSITRESTKPMTKINPAKFVREVRQEMDKVTWPSRKETMVSTLMVLGLATAAATFFVFIDWLIGTLVRAIIGI